MQYGTQVPTSEVTTTTIEAVKANFPAELRDRAQWVVWKFVLRKGQEKPTKVPYNPITYQKAKPNEPATWASFELACAVAKNHGFDGVGYVFCKDDPYVGIDFDACVSNGQIDPQVGGHLQHLNSYSEYSPSGTGVHVIVRGVLPSKGRKNAEQGIEMYNSERFFTVTGRHIEGMPSMVMARDEQLAALHTKVFYRPQSAKAQTSHEPSANIPTDDEELLELMFSSKAGPKIRSLWNGDTSAYNGDDSSADLALCSYLAFWTAKNAERIDRMFRQSKRMREKWERADYRQRTIATAIDSTSEVYEAKHRPGRRPGGVGKEHPRTTPKNVNGSANQDTHGAVTTTDPMQPDYLTDFGNGCQFATQHGQNLRYVEEWGWLCWDGKVWKRDQCGEVMHLAKSTALSIFDEAQACLRLAQEAQVQAKAAAEAGREEVAIEAENRASNLTAMAKKLSKWALNSQSVSRLEAMVKLATSELPIPARPETFDTSPWLLNCQNGTINLKRGELYPHRLDDYITKVTPVVYDPLATCPVWLASMQRWMDGKPHMIRFLQQLAGYSITGDVSEQKLGFPYGDGSNGKSTWINTLLAMLGKDYATQAAPDLLTAGRNAHPTELADLRGIRLVASIEVDDGKKMAEGLVKQLTGGDKVKARFMRQDFFEFDPTHKIFLVANHKPIVTGTDYAIWRRILLIPFTVTISQEEKDPRLSEKLQQELPGILAWAVQGCLDWQKHGLIVPDEVRLATDTYKSESDKLAAFLSECTVKVDVASVKASELYKAWAAWCIANGENARTSTWFGLELSKRGYEKSQNYRGIFYRGIGLLDEHGDE